MDPQQVLESFNAQIRRNPQVFAPQQHVESDASVTRVLSRGSGWAGVTWSDFDEATADLVIAAQVRRFAPLLRAWEWKYYSYDLPRDLPDRLRAAGFLAQPMESLMVAEVADLERDVPPPDGIRLVPVAGDQDIAALVSVHDQVFGGDHSDVARYLRSGLANVVETGGDAVSAVVAWSGDIPVCAGRVEFHPGTEFASLWGGGTLTGFRGRGVYRALVAHRAGQAAARGFRYLQVDASGESRPILQELGFVKIATTTPFWHPGGTTPGN